MSLANDGKCSRVFAGNSATRKRGNCTRIDLSLRAITYVKLADRMHPAGACLPHLSEPTRMMSVRCIDWYPSGTAWSRWTRNQSPQGAAGGSFVWLFWHVHTSNNTKWTHCTRYRPRRITTARNCRMDGFYQKRYLDSSTWIWDCARLRTFSLCVRSRCWSINLARKLLNGMRKCE